MKPGRGAAPLALAVVLALTLRLLSWERTVRPDGTIRLGPDGDPYEHLRRIEATIRGWPLLPFFDPEADYPYGALNYWPPLPDWTAATILRAALGAEPPREAVLVFMAVVPLVFGAAAVVLAYRLGIAWGLEPPEAGWAAVLYAVTAPVVAYSNLGRFDNHMVEAAAVPALAWALSVPTARGAAAAAAVLGAFCLSWNGAWVYVGLAAVHAAVSAAHAQTTGTAGGGARGHLLRGAAVVGGAGLAMAPLALLGPWRDGFHYDAVSPFQVVLAASLAAGLGVAAARNAAAGTAAAAAVMLGGAALWGSPVEAVRGAAGWIGARDPFLATVVEARPATPLSIVTFTGLHLALAPLGVILRAHPAAVVWTAATWSAAFAQHRFLVHYAPIGAVAAVHLVLRAGPPGSRRRRAAAAAVAVAAAISFARIEATLGVPPGVLEIEEAAAVIRAHAPDGRGAISPPWGMGHHFRALTGLPVTADPMGRGFADRYRLEAARSEDEAMALLRRRRVRFVVTPGTAAEAIVAGETVPAFRHLRLRHTTPGGVRVFEVESLGASP